MRKGKRSNRESLPWIDDHHEYGENEHEEPKVHEEEFAAPVNDLDDCGHERKHYDLPDDEFLDLFRVIIVRLFVQIFEGIQRIHNRFA